MKSTPDTDTGHRRFAIMAIVAVMGMGAPTIVAAQGTEPSTRSIVSQPARDVGIEKTQIPPLLVEVSKYIFPGGYVPALSQIMPAVERSFLWLSDLEVLRLHYAYTLEHWYARVVAAEAEIVALYDERFFRMWQFYLAGAINAFRNDAHVVFQLQLTRKRDASPIVRDYITDAEIAMSKGPEPGPPVKRQPRCYPSPGICAKAEVHAGSRVVRYPRR